MKKTSLLLLIFLFASLLAPPAFAQGAKRPANAPRRAPFVPMDFKKTFSAGPLSDPQPPSTLLPAGAATVELTLRAARPTVCRYSVGKDAPYEQMTPFDDKTPSTAPRTVIRGLDSDPARVNDVFIRCAAEPGAALHLQYRALPRVKPGFPRTANLWGSVNFMPKGMAYAARIDLWLGAHFTTYQIQQLRRNNPNIYILNSINTVENNDVPDDYFLRDTTGKKIEVWPGAYRLNMTRPEVAEYQARYAYQKILESGLMVDGCFFDNFMMTQRWLTHDIYDRPVQLDADGDGKPDDKDAFDKAWREGVFHELRTFRKLMPWALASGHSQGYPAPEIAEIFNGQSIGFYTTDVIEGKRPFNALWDYYKAWCEVTVKPAITSVESAVPDQIAYGYDYNPQKQTPPATWAFARDYYPYMRFGLAFTLMHDGYFMHELGDTMHGQDWWYDELDYKLGMPLGPARQVEIGQHDKANMLANGGFEDAADKAWGMWVNRQSGCAARFERDTQEKHGGDASIHITVDQTSRQPGDIDFRQTGVTLSQGKAYELRFWAKADKARKILVASSKGAPDWRNYGLMEELELTDQWKEYAFTFNAKESASDARIQFFCGRGRMQVWLDDVRLGEPVPVVFRRDFERGAALLNATRQRQTVEVGAGYARLKGGQAPRYQYILDDAGAEFKASGPWQSIDLGTKEWHAIPPYYHAWNNQCHKLSGGAGEAAWDLAARGAGTYTIQAWWAAAPEAKDWTKQAVYEVVAGGKVVATKTLDQTRDGDQWHTIAENLKLSPGERPLVRVRNAGSGALIADALHVFSAERYNDGSAAPQVTLEPMDGIVLRKLGD